MNSFFQRKYVKYPVVVLITVSLLLQFIPAPKKAQAWDPLTGLIGLLNEIKLKVASWLGGIPEISFAEKPDVGHTVWGIFDKNPLDDLSFRTERTLILDLTKPKEFLAITLLIPVPPPLSILKIAIPTAMIILGRTEIDLLTIFHQLDFVTANKIAKVKSFPPCEFKFPSLRKEIDEEVFAPRCQDRCLGKPEPKQCEEKCIEVMAREEKKKIQQACLELRRIQRAVVKEAYFAKQIYLQTDPLSTCLFARNCRTVCQLTLGDAEIEFNIVEALLWVLKFFGVPVDLLYDLYNLYNDIDNIIQIIEKAIKLIQTVIEFCQKIYTLLQTVLQILDGMVTGFAAVFGGPGATWTDTKTWEDLGNNMIAFGIEKNRGLVRVGDTKERIEDIIRKVVEEGGVGQSAEWTKLTEIFQNYTQKFINFVSLKTQDLDFIGYELKNIEDQMALVKQFAEDKYKTWDRRDTPERLLSENHLDEILCDEDKLVDLQRAVNEIRGVITDPLDLFDICGMLDRLDDVINIMLDGLRQVAGGIYGIKAAFLQALMERASQFGFLRLFIDKIQDIRDISKRILWNLDKPDPFYPDVISIVNSLSNRADEYFDPDQYKVDDYTSAGCGVSAGECPGGSVEACRTWCRASDGPCKSDRDECYDDCDDGDPCETACQEFQTYEDPADGSYTRARWACRNACTAGDTCSSACSKGYTQCRNDCSDDCDDNCKAATCEECTPCKQDREDAQTNQAYFEALFQPIETFVLQIKTYIGQYDGFVCPFTPEEFFDIGLHKKTGSFLSDFKCFEDLFEETHGHSFFAEAKIWLEILEKLAAIDEQISIITKIFAEAQPVIDVPPRTEELVNMSVTDELGQAVEDVWTTPFDVINDWFAKIRYALQKAQKLIDELYAPKYDNYIRNPAKVDLTADLQDLRENYLGNISTFLDALNQIIEAGRDLDQVEVSTEEIFNPYSVAKPGWYDAFYHLLYEARKAKWEVQDIQSIKQDIKDRLPPPDTYCWDKCRAVVFPTGIFPDDPSINANWQPCLDLCEELAFNKKGLVRAVHDLILNVLVLKDRIASTTERLGRIEKLQASLPANPDNPFENVTIEQQGIPASIENIAQTIKELNLAKAFADIGTAVALAVQLKDALTLGAFRVDGLIIVLNNTMGAGYSLEDTTSTQLLADLEAQDRLTLKNMAAVIQNETARVLMAMDVVTEGDSIASIAKNVETYLKRIMDAFALAIGIKELYFDVWLGRKALSKETEDIVEGFRKIKNSAKKLRDYIASSTDEEEVEFETRTIAISAEWEGIRCQSLAARGAEKTTGPQGGQVCPQVAQYSRILNSQFAAVQSSLRNLEIIRRAKEPVEFTLYVAGKKKATFFDRNGVEVELTIDNITIDFFDKYVVFESPTLNQIYQEAKKLTDRARGLWGLNTAMDFANNECTCGWSFCKFPICVSELPLTPQAITNPYCYLVYFLRVPLWLNARKLETFLEQRAVTEPDTEAIIQEIRGSFQPK